ncbi:MULTISPECIES: four helix bundle protein [unclassified Chryseobacterium]|uniref:four helix bundle protein n=1 Tax=unclassified Chryseobacterium TaxID=2593645 RepID=UPI00226A2123|nr:MULTISPECIES: four helix bundle protein [unclassified Chryseobacterium]
MSFKFEKLIIWQKSMDFGERIFKLSQNFPKEEAFNLTSQIRRASDSVALNISEGSILQSRLEFRKFLGYSIRSLAEVVTCLYKAKNRKYISEEDFNKLYDESYSLMNQIIAFRNQIKE